MKDKFNDYKKRYDKDNQKVIKEITDEITKKAKILRARIKNRHEHDTRVDYFFKLEQDLKNEFLKEDAPEDTLDLDDVKSLDEIKDQIEDKKNQYRKLLPQNKKESTPVPLKPGENPIVRDDVVVVALGGKNSAHESDIKINGVEIRTTVNPAEPNEVTVLKKSSKNYLIVISLVLLIVFYFYRKYKK